jgi:predicted DNA-binding transcriptional regulator AlpA
MAKQKEEQVNHPQQPLAISAKELAAMLGVSLRQVWRLDSSGMLPNKIRLGGSCKWIRSEIMSWLEHGCPDRQSWQSIKDNLGKERGNYAG